MRMKYQNKKITFKRIKNKILRTIFNDQWSLLVCDKSGNILKEITPPDDRFYADPFPVEYNGKTYIFIEQQIGHGNGTLGVIELYNDLSCSDFYPILEKNYHLSFPNIFSVVENNQLTWYMIPETHENKTIDLYYSTDFPFKWELKLTLKENVIAADTTLFFHDNLWWLFTSIGDKEKPVNSNLSLFYSDSFKTDKWKAHPLNPVVSTLNNSRMAGKIFTKDGINYRPSQNCKIDYGKEININKIITLSPNEYKEEIIETIYPEKRLHAICTHTINYSENYLLRDIKKRKRRF